MRKSIKISDKKFWLEYMYPCTIIKDRYTGAYSGGEWTCWPIDRWNVPDEIEEDDITCGDFWREFDTSQIGIGASPQQAINDLRIKLGAKVENKEYTIFEEKKLKGQTCFACKNLGYGCLGKPYGCKEYDCVPYGRLMQLQKTLIPKKNINKELYEC